MMYQKSFTNIMNKWPGFLQFASCTLVILSLLGCGTVQAEQTPVSNTPLSLISTPTRDIPQPTASPSGTATVAPIQTWTPVPTLPLEIRDQNLMELFLTNGGCDFPCWWGINSGDSTQKVYELAPAVGETPRTDGSTYYFTLSLDSLNLSDFDMSFFVDADQAIQRIEISLSQPSRFKGYYDVFETRLSLVSVLNNYGKPSDVLLLITPRFEPGETPRPYTLFLIYDMQDFGIAYSGFVNSENPLQVCSIKLDDHHLQNVTLYLQDPRLRIAEINRLNSTELRPLEQVTPMSLDDFYQIFSDSKSSQCIEPSNDVWQ